MTYFPPPHPATWAAATPAEAGLDPEALAAAARYAGERETPWARDLALMVTSDFQERPPWNETLGPVRPRGGPNGLVLRGGQIAAEWGETTRVDMTFSVAKSYLAILAGLAWDRGLIRDPHEEVHRTVEDGGFDPPHNDAITWHHLLQQTSEWEGVLWGKPDLVDRNRSSAGRPSAAPKGTHRNLHPPGGVWEYNDVRVNRLSLALLRLWRRPLPEVFRELVMDPIGASPDWQWAGYRNSWVEIDGRPVQSVSGGGLWGAASSSRRATRHESVRCCSPAVCGGAGAFSRRPGSNGCSSLARSTPTTVICGGSTPGAPFIRAPRRGAITRAAPAAI